MIEEESRKQEASSWSSGPEGCRLDMFLSTEKWYVWYVLLDVGLSALIWFLVFTHMF
jgi:hypothetical protein